MNLKNLFFLFVILLGNSFSSFSLSHHVRFSSNENDSANTNKPVISELDLNRMLLIDATLELNEALLAGVKASLDTLKVPSRASAAKSDTIEKLRMMKREREQKEMKVYLVYMKDSLTADCAKLAKEKEAIQTRLGIYVPAKKENENVATVKPPEEVKKVEPLVVKQKQISVADTAPVASLPVKKEELKIQTVASKDSMVVSKKDKKHLKQDKNPKPIPTDTIFASNNKKAKSKSAVDKNKTVSSADTSTDKTQAPLTKADVFEGRRVVDTSSSTGTDTAVRIKSRYYTTYAQKAIIEKNYPKALDYINSAIEFWKGNYDAWFTKGQIEELSGDPDKAMNAYRQCYLVDSTKATLFYSMALLNLQLHNREVALSNLNKAIALDPDYVNAYMKRASIYSDTANYNAAIADYDHILKLNRNYYNAYKGRGISKLMQRNFKEAINDFTRYMIYDQSDPEVYYYRGLAKISNNDWLDGCLELSMSANMGYTAASVAQKKNCE